MEYFQVFSKIIITNKNIKELMASYGSNSLGMMSQQLKQAQTHNHIIGTRLNSGLFKWDTL